MPTSRNIPAGLSTALDFESSSEHLLVFLVFTHETLATPIRVVSDSVNHVYGGETYAAFPFQIEILSDDDNPPRAQLSVQNIDREIGNAVRRVSTPVGVTITVIAGSEFNRSDPRQPVGTPAVAYSATELELVDVSVDALNVTGTLRLRNYTQEQWPATMGTKDRLPGLFR